MTLVLLSSIFAIVKEMNGVAVSLFSGEGSFEISKDKSCIFILLIFGLGLRKYKRL